VHAALVPPFAAALDDHQTAGDRIGSDIFLSAQRLCALGGLAIQDFAAIP
jgi:hypothetical protein